MKNYFMIITFPGLILTLLVKNVFVVVKIVEVFWEKKRKHEKKSNWLLIKK